MMPRLWFMLDKFKGKANIVNYLGLDDISHLYSFKRKTREDMKDKSVWSKKDSSETVNWTDLADVSEETKTWIKLDSGEREAWMDMARRKILSLKEKDCSRTTRLSEISPWLKSMI